MQFNSNVRYQLKTPICRERTPRFQRVCGRQVGRHRPSCLADTIKPFAPFQWQLLKRECQDFGWPDARGSRARGMCEGEWLDRACGVGQDFVVVAGRKSLRYPCMIRWRVMQRAFILPILASGACFACSRSRRSDVKPPTAAQFQSSTTPAAQLRGTSSAGYVARYFERASRERPQPSLRLPTGV